MGNGEDRTSGPTEPRSFGRWLLIPFGRRWWRTTLLVLAAMGVMIRLGFWQLDRLAQRRARNAQIARQLALPPLDLTAAALPADPGVLKNRRVTVRGQFDFAHQVALLYQNWMGAPGIHLIAPLRIEGSDRAVLVDRGWVPEAEAAPERWSQFDEPGTVVVTGFLRLSQPPPRGRAGGKAAASPSFQTGWYRVDIPALQAQTPYELLPVYILQAPADDDGTHLPYRSEPSFDLSDGPHLGYAIQWFLFALILGGGYLRYVSGKEQDVLENSTCNS